MKDINYALVAKPHPNRYVVHKYWARKPHNVVAQYISSYSKPDDIVLDPFCGSGVTFCEALIQNRRAIALDLNPMACFITRNVSKPYSTDEIKEEFERIKEDVQDFILPKYQTKCRKNGHSANILATIFKKDKPVEIRYFCPTCNKKYADPPNDFDLQLLQQIVSEDITDWYPTAPLRYPDGAEFKEGTHKDGFDTVDSLFTKRNLLCLARLFKRIESIKSKELREVFEFAFTSMVHLASKMCPVANPEGKGHWSKLSATSFWSQHRFYLPDIHMESNVFMLFLSRINGVQGVLNAKEDTNNSVKKYEEAKSFEDFLQHDKNALIINDSALDLIDPTNPQAGILKPNSVDYIFADPPYGQDIQYFELDTLWNSWLGFKRDPAEEIIINENQGKDLDLYSLMLHRAFKQMFYVLKPNKRLTITFHNTDIKIRNALIRSAVFAGFELEKIIYQPPARPSAKQLLQPYGSAVGDYYIRFSKPKSYSTKKKVSDIDSELYEKIVVESVKKILAERGEPTAYTWIINTIDLELTKIGYNLKADPEDTKRILDKHKDKEFAVVEVIEGLNKVKRWWFKDPSIIKYLHRIPLSERIERSVIDVLRQNVVVHFDDILQTIFIEFP
ncbi:MAG: DNA methyltransferase, partial [Halobacteriota archaeon]